MINQLQSRDRRFNLIDKHGGAGIQFSLWGTGVKDEHEHRKTNGVVVSCDALPNPEPHPFNPIQQAKAAGCRWDDPTNDVDEMRVVENGG